MRDEDLLELAADLAGRAAAAIMGVRLAGFAVTRKQDQSPVTVADTIAETLIVEGLRAATPDFAVVAEEEIAAGHEPVPGARFWLVDPLDGTREFAAGRDAFTVNIGLVEGTRPIIGAVAVPAHGEVFGGIVGNGAWKQDQTGRRRITTRTPPPDGITVMASRQYRDDPRLPEFLRGQRVSAIHHLGSAEKFCRLAEGVADVYPRFGPTMEWDTAAPQAILEAAGGSVRRFDTTPLAYRKPGWTNPPFIARGS